MWSLLQSALNYLYGLFVRVVSVKFFIFTAVYWLLIKLVDMAKAIIGNIVDLSGLSSLISSLPSDFIFYLKLFRVDVGLPMIVAAMVVKFSIRRLPVIG